MGRMLEALKQHAEPAAPPEQPVLVALHPEPPPAEAVEAAEDVECADMPFVEVGGPRPAAPGTPRLEFPVSRPATLQIPPLRNVRLESRVAPAPRVAAELMAYHQPDHAVSQQYSTLFGQIAPSSKAAEPAAVLVFTSLSAGAGVTTTLLNLAICGCRQHHQRIVVIDTGRARPVAERLGVSAAVGLNDVLRGTAALERAVLATPQEELFLVSAGPASDGSPWSTDAMRWTLTWLRSRYDLVLIDAAPWSDSGDVRMLAALADAVYLVVDAAEAEQPSVRAATRSVAQLGSRLGGLIVTQ